MQVRWKWNASRFVRVILHRSATDIKWHPNWHAMQRPWVVLSQHFRTPPLSFMQSGLLKLNHVGILRHCCKGAFIRLPRRPRCPFLLASAAISSNLLDQMFHVPVASFRIVIPILVGEVQKVHHQIAARLMRLANAHIANALLSCVVRSFMRTDTPMGLLVELELPPEDIGVIHWSFFFCRFSMHWLIILRIVCVVTCCNSVELLSNPRQVVVGTHKACLATKLALSVAYEPSPLFFFPPNARWLSPDRLSMFFSVQRLHGFRQVVQHVQHVQHVH